ncbi:hypothetical protein GQ457_01G038560 [Hibiscus cannabinus]
MSNGLDEWFRRLRKEKKLTVQDLQAKIGMLNELNPTNDVLGDLLETKVALNLEMDKEELYWEQRARMNWLQHGDRNTAFFHRFASERKRKNRIVGFKDEYGNFVEDEQGLHSIAREYFSDLFQSQGVDIDDRILEGVDSCINAEMNTMLSRAYTKAEAWEAVKSIAPLKASGEDGLGAVFYQKFWHIIGDDISDYCIAVLKGDSDIKAINHTHIVLIPKVDSPVLSNCIDSAQSAFVPNRLITDNIIVNVDASFKAFNRSAITGAIIRDSEGYVVGASRRLCQSTPSAFTAEALAVLHGIILAANLGFHFIWVESDSLAVVKILNSNTIDKSEIGAITWDSKVKACIFEECKFLFVPRQGNRVAHALVSDYDSDLFEEFWVEDAPALVLSMADSDRRYLDPP